MLNEFLAIVDSALGSLPAWLYWALGILTLTSVPVIWFFRTQLHIKTKPHLPASAWGRLALGVMLCLWAWALFLAWPWLNWHYPRVLFVYEVPQWIGLVVVLIVLNASALYWLYCFTFVENGNSRFWLKVIKFHEAPCLWVLGSSHRATYELHLRWRFVLWGETQAMRWQEGSLMRALWRQRWLGLLLAGGAAVGVLVGSLAWVHDEPLEAIRNALFPTDPAHAASAGVWSLFSVAVAAPVAFALWKFRDTNQLWQIENQRKDTNLKDFQQLCEWASGMHLVEDSVSTQTTVGKKESTTTQSKPPLGEGQTPNRREGSLALQVSAVHQLQGYLMGEYGQQFKRPAFVLLLSLWEQSVKEFTPDPAGFKMPPYSPLREAIQRSLLARNGKAFRDHPTLLKGRSLFWLGFGQIDHSSPLHLSHLILPFVNLQGARLMNARLQGANLCNVQLQNADLSRAQLQDAKLEVANLEHALLFGASLCGAVMRSADFRASNMWSANLQGADLQHLRLTKSVLYRANFKKSSMKGAVLINVISDESTDFTDAVTTKSTRVIVAEDPDVIIDKIHQIPTPNPILTHALRLKLRKVNHLKLDPSAYREFRSVWLGISKAERKAIYDKAYEYSEKPSQFIKDFPLLARSRPIGRPA